ncbi:biotin transporter BioY [Paraeggerthella hongkongensis]|uniref:Biotin transporter n=1 Tax=Paraeggerthella hongkongensis TaxID=230658 RepID=A0A3N0B3B1_9ACTN|nr:biotin transporter BioY [Paraeggerthella hongkongensis]RNL41572.1 biotin transporter BioY [Paraeggerthella hongkongensis]
MPDRATRAAARSNALPDARNHTRSLVLCALFCALIAVGAFVKIPVPVVPFTLQFLFTTMAGLLLGPRWGTLSVAAYVALGLIGLPIFASGGGIGYLAQPSFGYLIGFCAGTYLTARIAWAAPKPSTKRLLASCFAGLGAVYLMGMAYFYLISNFVIGAPIALGPLVLYCFVLAVPGDIALCFASAVLAKRLLPLVASKRGRA